MSEWRPMSEIPRDGTWILVKHTNPEGYLACRLAEHVWYGTKLWLDINDEEVSLVYALGWQPIPETEDAA